MNNAAIAISNVEFANDNTPAVSSVVKTGKCIAIRNVKRRDSKRGDRIHTGETCHGQHVDVVVGESVTLFGAYPNHVNGPQPYRLTFVIGDHCEYDSYNLAYTGPIVAITASGVSVRDMSGNVKRLDWHTFTWRNWDYSAEKIAARNSNWSD